MGPNFKIINDYWKYGFISSIFNKGPITDHKYMKTKNLWEEIKSL